MTATTLAPDTATSTTEAVSQTRELQQMDRCDSCRAQAFMRATKGGRADLLFCGHHGRRHQASLIAQGFIVDDQTHRINEKPSVSANKD
jgi:hypothetical protein